MLGRKSPFASSDSGSLEKNGLSIVSAVVFVFFKEILTHGSIVILLVNYPQTNHIDRLGFLIDRMRQPVASFGVYD